jgi:hypothetical protein
VVLTTPVARVQLAPSLLLNHTWPSVVPVVASCSASSERVKLLPPVQAIDQMKGRPVCPVAMLTGAQLAPASAER